MSRAGRVLVGRARRYRARPPRLDAEAREALERNATLRGLWAGQRCFILASGPSIAEQEVRPLAGERCISVANFFLHQDYQHVAPAFHCVAPLHPPFTEEDGVRWFSAMNGALGDAQLVLSLSDRELVERNDLFAGRTVDYVSFTDTWASPRNDSFDLARPVPPPQSVSIMALLLALHLGASPVYLLGTDHTVFDPATGRYDYRHFHQRGANALGLEPTPPDLEIVFESLFHVWRQYKILRSTATGRGVEICNASAGGILDLFPRVRLEDVVAGRPVTLA